MRASTLAFLLLVLALAAAIVWASGQPNIPINRPGHFSPDPSVSAS